MPKGFSHQAGLSYEEGIILIFSKLVAEILDIPAENLLPKVKRRRRIQGRVSRHEIDLSLASRQTLALAECKFRTAGPCPTSQVRDFWSQCFDIQAADQNIEVHGFFFCSSYYETAAIQWVTFHMLSSAHSVPIRLYTIKTWCNYAYAILINNLTTQSWSSVTMNLAESQKRFESEELSFDRMICAAIEKITINQVPPHNDLDNSSMACLDAIEMLANALLHKNYLEECIVVTLPFCSKMPELLKSTQHANTINKLHEIFACFQSAHLRRFFITYKRHPSTKSLKPMMDMIAQYRAQDIIPNGIVTLMRICMPLMAKLADFSTLRSFHSECIKAIEKNIRDDSYYLHQVTQLALAKVHVASGKFDLAEDFLCDFGLAIQRFPTERHRIAGIQTLLRAKKEYYEAIGDKVSASEVRHQLIVFQSENSLGIPIF
ncbi:MAG: hypothetical protein K8R75_07460 [Deltaproteobacteria bacterium]|jgi:hypothetical protein|nr:hypothetical protein [Deltaproteobacteria bacterium]